jgi:hypothetical protein
LQFSYAELKKNLVPFTLKKLVLDLGYMSELQVKVGKKLPWVMGSKIRLPRVKFPEFNETSMVLPTPSKSILLIAIYAFLFWLVAGGIYLWIRDPIALGADSSGSPVWLYPSTHEAFIIESIVAAVIVFMGGIGFILMFQATKNAFNYGYAIKLLILGLSMAGLSFGLLQWMISEKGG